MPKKGQNIFKVGLFFILLFCCFFLSPSEIFAKRLNVPLFSQLDCRWAGEKLGFSNLTIRNYGCALTSKAMVFNYYSANFTNPSKLNRYLKSHNGFASGCLMKWNNTGAPNGVNYAGGVSNNRSVIKEKVNQGLPLIAQVYKVRMPMHFVVICGQSGNDFIINDPWQGVRVSLESRKYHLQRLHLYQKGSRSYSAKPIIKKSPALKITQGLWLKSYQKAYVNEPFDAQFTVKNFGNKTANLKNLSIFVRGPKGQKFDFQGSGKIKLKPGKSYRLFRKTKHLGRKGVIGTYRFGCSYQDSSGNWHLLTAQKGAVNNRKLKVVNRTKSQAPPPTQKLLKIEENFDNEEQIFAKNKIRIENGKAILDSWQKVFTIQSKDDFAVGNCNGLYFDEQKQGLKIQNPSIKILQIYPPNHNKELLSQIINQYAPDPNIFSVSSVSVRNFNQKKLDDGKTLDLNPFNLLYFGVADVYGSNPPHWINDLSSTGESLVRQFHSQGKGIVFTHDTLGAGDPCWLKHNYFNRLSDITGIATDTSLGSWKEFRTVNLNPAINPDHPMLNYPFQIPAQFSVIHTHRLYQKVIAGEVFAYGQSPSDLYWQANNNVTFFSYGNVEQMPLEWEGKALINTLSNTYQGGSYLSPIFDTESGQGKIESDFFIEDQNQFTDCEFNLRFGNGPLFDSTWSDWIKISKGQKMEKQGRFCQYQIKMKSANLALSPLLKRVILTCDPLYYSQGSIISNLLSPAEIIAWDHLDFSSDDNNQTIRIDFLDENNQIVVADIKRNYNFSSLDPKIKIKVQISLITSDFLKSPAVDWWVVYYWKEKSAPKGA